MTSALPIALWKYDLDAESYFQPFPLKAQGTVDTSPGSNPTTITLPNGYVTQAGDCIVVGFAAIGGASAGASGALATWQTVLNGLSSSDATGISIGYNCSAGATTFTFAWSGASATGEIQLVIGVFGGVRSASNPISATNQKHAAGSATEGIGVVTSTGHLTLAATDVNTGGTFTTFVYPSAGGGTGQSVFRVGEIDHAKQGLTLEYGVSDNSVSVTAAGGSGIFDQEAVSLIPAP